ncbi:MAG: hypothetical protein ABI686_05590 [Acidobacteriota bacterium]
MLGVNKNTIHTGGGKRIFCRLTARVDKEKLLLLKRIIAPYPMQKHAQ